ncbi:MAG TPA: histidine kinase [Cyanobacteria bacterium UBA11372]|nr:histidine kinase [Cyanobacteria bacterium UBA11372]
MFHLKVEKIDQTCRFELSWGKGQQLVEKLNYPEILTTLYKDWQQIYLSFYTTALRGRVQASGSLNAPPPPVDWHAKLVQAEAKLLYEFHRWLRSGDLFEIRRAIANAAANKIDPSTPPVNVFLTCSPIELERFPWEAWEISDFANAGNIRMIRTPQNIRVQADEEQPLTHRKARVLAILGDETGLNFEADRQAVRSLSGIAEVEFVGWQKGQDSGELKMRICHAIADEKGWDILFFAGHSNETCITGGQLAIAPNTSMLISEIAPYITKAKERGLQFAIFNSCSGLTIANVLIDLGLSAVAIMREPVHNKVAAEFLVRFLQSLAEYKDVHESMLAACQYLKLEKNLTYPSAYLIPSLYCHPGSKLFCLQPFGFKQQLQQLLPTRQELLFLVMFLLISWQLPVQDFLLERRVLKQAIYRQLTGQTGKNDSPPVLLIPIDQDSIEKDNIGNPRPMPRSYIARLIDRLSALNARVIGIDFLLSRPQKNNDKQLAKSLRNAVQKQPFGTWFVFVELQDDSGQWLRVRPEIASKNWSLYGDMRVILGYMKLGTGDNYDAESLPFSYAIALAYKENFDPKHAPLRPQLKSQKDFLSQVKTHIQNHHKQSYTSLFPPASHLQPITAFSYQIGQTWLHPIMDFSIPPARVYNSIPAGQLLRARSDAPQLSQVGKQAAMIVPGGYLEAGVSKEGEDNFPLPSAIAYWRNQAGSVDNSRIFTGGEAHAYMVHHFVTGRLVIPIPDFWLIPPAALLGKVAVLALLQPNRRRQIRKSVSPWKRETGRIIVLGIATAGYGLVSLQVYISSAILFPWLLPSAVVWSYALPALIRRKNYG